MATGTSKGSAATARGSAAVTHGRAASGASAVREGFSFSREQDLAFALGWPHFRELITGSPDDADPAARAKQIVTVQEWPEEWPRATATRVARAWSVLATQFNAKGTLDLTKEGKAALASAAELKPDEVRRFVAASFDPDGSSAPDPVENLLLLEALGGTDLVSDAVASSLEELDDERLIEHEDDLRQLARVTGFFLLRLPADRAKVLRERLEKVFARGLKAMRVTTLKRASSEEPQSIVRGLDLALHGRLGAERSGSRPEKAVEPRDLTLAHDDPEWVVKELKTGGPPSEWTRVDARLAFIGGQPVIDYEVKNWKKYKNDAAFLRQLGAVRNEALLPVFLEMATASKAKKQAVQWFVDHADYARAFLEEAARGKGAAKQTAAELLKKLG